MNQESYLLMETFQEGAEVRERATSVGEKDGVYLFDRMGRKTVKRTGEQIPLD
jgi:hypothetical protein